MRLMLVWRIAIRLPTVMVTIDMPASRAVQLTRNSGRAVRKTRIRIAKPAALGPTDRNAVMGVGSALIRVRRPLVERNQRDLEPEANQQQDDRRDGDPLDANNRTAAKECRHGAQVRRASHAIQE